MGFSWGVESIGLPRRRRGAASLGMALGLLLALSAGGCGRKGAPVDLPLPSSGRLLTLEEQERLSDDQYEEYCGMLQTYLDSLYADLDLADALEDSLSALVDSLAEVSRALNKEKMKLDDELRRMQRQRDSDVVYVTREGDTLTEIARIFFQGPAAWRKIYDANKDVIKEPGEKLPAGLRLRIPK